jgi:hypothetical protein
MRRTFDVQLFNVPEDKTYDQLFLDDPETGNRAVWGQVHRIVRDNLRNPVIAAIRDNGWWPTMQQLQEDHPWLR